MRVFIAIPIPATVKAELTRLQAELRETVPDKAVRWVSSNQFHLTLQFLGEVDPSRIDDLVARTREACSRFSSHRLQAGQLGFFPNERRPRVLWAGLHCSTEQLAELQKAIQHAALPFAEKEEDRVFTAHLTLARINAISSEQARKLVQEVNALAKRELGEWLAEGVEVIQSELNPAGSRYTILAQIPFALKSGR